MTEIPKKGATVAVSFPAARRGAGSRPTRPRVTPVTSVPMSLSGKIAALLCRAAAKREARLLAGPLRGRGLRADVIARSQVAHEFAQAVRQAVMPGGAAAAEARNARAVMATAAPPGKGPRKPKASGPAGGRKARRPKSATKKAKAESAKHAASLCRAARSGTASPSAAAETVEQAARRLAGYARGRSR